MVLTYFGPTLGIYVSPLSRGSVESKERDSSPVRRLLSDANPCRLFEVRLSIVSIARLFRVLILD